MNVLFLGKIKYIIKKLSFLTVFCLIITLIIFINLYEKPLVERRGIFPNDLIIFNNSNDNILITKTNYIQQVRYIPHHILQARQSTRHNYVSPLVILIADVFWPAALSTFSEIKEESFLNASLCPVHECYITYNWTNLNRADVIMFHLYASNWNKWIPNYKEQNQIWVFSHIESPKNTHYERDPDKMLKYQEKMNWSASYRRDSNIYFPYGLYLSNELISEWNISKWRFVSIYQNKQNLPKKLVTAMISNCLNDNKRMDLIQELRKYVLVDNLTPNLECATATWNCPRFTDQCFKQLANNYKFFLAFENSNCPDYITEKFYLNALAYGFF